MQDAKEGERLWRKIGINGHVGDSYGMQLDDIRSKASRSSVYSSVQWQEAYRNKEQITPASNSVLEQPPFAPPSMPLRRSDSQILWQEEVQSPSYPRMVILQEESQIEQVQLRQESSGVHSIDYEGLQTYNQEISHIPESVTPLVYSKNSRKEDVRFSKQTAKAIIIKIRLAETKDLLQRVRVDFLEFSSRVREEHLTLEREVCNKYFQMARENSMRVQQSVFTHKQDCQELKYELDVIKAKEELMHCPVDSQLIFNNPQSLPNNQLKLENDDLKSRLVRMVDENAKLVREGESFKRKISEIQAKTLQIRQSNDKLYQYIFDMEQKMAYYEEQIPKISQRVREETQKRLQSEFDEQNTAHYEEMTRSFEQIDMLQSENLKLANQIKRSNEFIVQFQKENSEIKIKLEHLEEELRLKQQETEEKTKDFKNLQAECKRLRSQNQQLIKEREDLQQWKEEQRRESNSRLSRAYSIKEDKKLIEALEIEKLVLQKQNIQLKATVQFYNKNQNFIPNFAPQKTYPLASLPSYQSPTNIQSQQNIDQKDRELQIKERELISLQNYLQDEARRLDSKQRDIESEYVIKRAQEAKIREYIQPTQPVRINPIDDYGMKKLPITQAKQLQPQRRSQFSSSETQAIIEKVKLRQKIKENGGCICISNQTRNCHCDAHSRGSRTSQDSNSRDYLRMQHHRPVNYSPGYTGYQYLKRQQKSSKMKQIQDKVRRLKSELKSSFTTMNS